MKRSELIISALLVPIDFLMLLLAAGSAYALRFQTGITELRPVLYQLPLQTYVKVVFGVAFVWILMFALAGLYAMKGNRRLSEEVSRIFLACSAAIMLLIVVIFFQRELFSSRFIIITSWILSIVYVSVARAFVRLLQRQLYKRGVGIHRLVVIGTSLQATRIIEEFQLHKTFGYQIVDHVSDVTDEALKKIKKLATENRVDEILQVDLNVPRSHIEPLLDLCTEYHLVFKYVADLLGTHVKHIAIDTVTSVPIIELKKTPLDGWWRIFKRVFDLVGAFTLFILSSPVLLLTVGVIKLESKGPVIFSNDRVGQQGKLFATLKFRTMQHRWSTGRESPNQEAALRYEAELIRSKSIKQGPLYKIQDDPRLTRIGHFLRVTSIDELPQLLNVLKGEMSLVGPRPHQPREVNRYETRHKKVLTVRPGMTGLAQVSGRSDLDFEEEIRLDTYYIENWSPFLDFWILLKTPFILFKHRRAA